MATVVDVIMGTLGEVCIGLIVITAGLIIIYLAIRKLTGA